MSVFVHKSVVYLKPSEHLEVLSSATNLIYTLPYRQQNHKTISY